MPALPSSVLYLVACLIWGSTWMAITFQFGSVSPLASVGYRFLLAGLIMLGWSWRRGEGMRLPAGTTGLVLLQGVLLFGIGYGLTYEAERHIASGLMAVLNSSMLVFNLIGMQLTFGRRAGRRAWFGAALGGLGIFLVFWPELGSVQDASGWLGVACGLAAALVSSASNMITQHNHRVGVPLLAGTGWSMLAGAGVALAASCALNGVPGFDTRPSYLLSLLYLAVFGSVVAFAAYFTLIGRIGAGRAGYIAVAVPILALLLSGLFEGFVWRGWTIAGIACALAGNLVTLVEPGPLLRRLGWAHGKTA